jgi:ATP-dependent Clp protease protease subunit
MDEKHKWQPGDEIWVTEFTEESAQEFREQILTIARSSSRKPIVVYIDSYGGLVDSLAKMIGTLDEIDNPVLTVVMGKAMSCGSVLFSHGDVRFCEANARIMIHEVSSGTSGNVQDIKVDAEETIRMNKQFMGLLAENCGIEGGYQGLHQILKDNGGRDKYLTAEQAVKFGIADHVGVPKIRVVPRYEISLVDNSKRIKDKEVLKDGRKKRSTGLKNDRSVVRRGRKGHT